MKAIGIIPARLGSTRFPQKILADINGKPLIWHVWHRSKKSKLLDDVIVACDDKEVLKKLIGLGIKVVLTSKKHQSGTDRIAEVAKKVAAEIIVNIQGDEPLIHPSIIDSLVRCISLDATIAMATVKKKIKDKRELYNPNIVKVVSDNSGDALYFSRSLIPYPREKDNRLALYYKHLGIYAYRKNFLLRFVKLRKSLLEGIEQLEQLRALENGFKIRVIETKHDTIAVDVLSDLKRVKAIMR